MPLGATTDSGLFSRCGVVHSDYLSNMFSPFSWPVITPSSAALASSLILRYGSLTPTIYYALSMHDLTFRAIFGRNTELPLRGDIL